MALVLSVSTLSIWVVITLLPWRPWASEPYLDADESGQDIRLDNITVLIPARNEAASIPSTLHALDHQGHGLNVIVVDDQSTDDTAAAARHALDRNLIVVPGKPLPIGWSGKLWALEQGRQYIQTPYTLLIDADIELQPGMVATAFSRLKHQDCQLLSLMAFPRMCSFWEKLVMPAFVYFFKLIYPFRLANSRLPWVAAAAGGFVLMETRLLNELGGFSAIRGALIDDCALARCAKSMNYRTWIGLSHSVRSQRSYRDIWEIWNMVARTAFTQLHYSIGLLILCTLLMLLGYAVPLLSLFGTPWELSNSLAAIALGFMMFTFRPTLKFYGRTSAWVLAFPLIGMLFLAMTWTSALRYWRGERAQWRGRTYSAEV